MKRKGTRRMSTDPHAMPRIMWRGQQLRLLSVDECHEMWMAVNRARSKSQPKPIRLAV